MIHKTAVVDSRAELGEGVEIGPCVVIDGPVKIGPRTRLVAFVHVSGNTEIGADNVIHPFAVIGHEPQHLHYRGEPTRLVIGDKNIIREHAEIHRGTPQGTGITRVGDQNLIMGHAHIAHDCEVGNKVTLANGALLAGHVKVEDNVFLSGNAVVHQFCRIGQLAIIQGLGGIGKDVPPFFMASGINTIANINVVGLRRNGFTHEQIERVRALFRLFVRYPVPDAVAEAERISMHPEVRTILDFIKADSKRSLCRFGRKDSARRSAVNSSRTALEEDAAEA